MERTEFERYASLVRPRLLSLATAMLGSGDDAEDAVQDAMVKLWFFRHRLDEYSSPQAPAVVILRRVCLSRLRSASRHESLDDALQIACESDAAADPDLYAAIDRLPPTEQAVLKMKHLDGLETGEIASLTGSTPTAVRTALSRARKRVRDIYLRR